MKQDTFDKAKKLRFHAAPYLWEEGTAEQRAYLARVVGEEFAERHRRKLNMCLKKAHLKHWNPMSSFDWTWPSKVDRALIEELLTLDFLEGRGNVVLMGPNGVGKTMIATNLIHQAALKGIPARFVECSTLLATLVKEAHSSGLERALQSFTKPKLLAIDELGYLSFEAKHADLLFQLIHRRAQSGSTIITTNRSFGQWTEVFPNSSSLTALLDRLLERADVIKIEGNSYRAKNFEARKLQRQKKGKSEAEIHTEIF